MKPHPKKSREAAEPLARNRRLLRQNLRTARRILGRTVTPRTAAWLETLTQDFGFSLPAGDLQIVNCHWYVTHTGLLALSRRRKCRGIHVESVDSLCDSTANRFVLKATVYPSKGSAGFVGYAEMRVAETRAVNRALRKAYGIGICSVEEIGTIPNTGEKLPPQNPNENGNGNGSGPKVRDRLCQLIRRHRLDAQLVKAFALDYCGTQSLKDATRAQIENFVRELADWAEKDRNALLCQLNSYSHPKQEVDA